MWSTIVTVTLILLDDFPDIWIYLPQLTIGLRFCTALLGFILTTPPLVRRVRRWLRRRRRR